MDNIYECNSLRMKEFMGNKLWFKAMNIQMYVYM